MKRLVGLVMVALLVLGSAALADEVVLKGGDRISGRIAKRTEHSVTLETEFGKLVIPRSDIERIKLAAPIQNEYLERIRLLARQHRELAKWCEEKGLAEQAQENIEAALELENLLAASKKTTAKKSKGVDIKVFDAVWEAVRDNFYDRENYNGCDWKAMREKYLPRARAAKTQPELYDVCNIMLTELKASHCYLWSPYIWEHHVRNEFRGETTLQAGIEILKLGDKYFVKWVYDGGPADKAGVEVGEELVSVNGEPAGASDRLALKDGISTDRRALYTLRTDDGAALALGLRRRKDGIAVEVQVKPAMTSMLEAAKQSVSVIERGGRKLGYVHLWHFMNRGMTSVIRDALGGKLKDCDGLVLDVRGRGGSPWVIRQVLRVFTRGRWTKPAVLVVDEDTASAKEIFAYYWKEYKLGPVVGRTTAGHVLGSGMLPMPDGSMLLLARVKVTRMTGGKDLEGRGVEPDVKVKETFEYCGGEQPMIKKAIEVLLERIRSAPGDKQSSRTVERPSRAA